MNGAFLAADLEVESTRSLRPLAVGLERHGLWKQAGPLRIKPGVWFASFQAHQRVFRARGKLNAQLDAVLDILEGLDRATRAAFEACSARRIDLGFDGPTTPQTGIRSLSEGVSASRLARIAALGVELRWTIYSPVPSAAPKPAPPTGASGSRPRASSATARRRSARRPSRP